MTTDNERRFDFFKLVLENRQKRILKYQRRKEIEDKPSNRRSSKNMKKKDKSETKKHRKMAAKSNRINRIRVNHWKN